MRICRVNVARFLAMASYKPDPPHLHLVVGLNYIIEGRRNPNMKVRF